MGRLISVLLLVLALVLPARAWQLKAQRWELPSGLVVIHSEQTHLPLVMLTLLIKAGPLDEPPELAGLAYLTAAMLREGTKHRSAEALSEEIDFLGASLQASAGPDYSTVKLSVLKKDVQKGFELLADMLLNPAFPQEELQALRERTLEDLRRRQEEPSFLAQRAFQKAVYGEHPYGRLLQGSAETLRAIKREDLLRFWQSYYRPNNAVLVVVGALSRQELSSLIEKYLGEWRPAPLPERPRYQIPPPLKRTILIERPLEQATVLMGHVGVRRSNPDIYALKVMNYVLGGGGFASRLMRKIRDEMGLAYDVHSFFSSRAEPGVFQIGLQTKNPSARLAIETVLKEVQRLRTEEVSSQELADAKAFLIGSFPRRLQTMRRMADFLASVEFYGLGLRYPERFRQLIGAVSAEDIKRVARKYLRPQEMVLAVVGNLKEAGLDEP
jgi:zinc protease